MKKLLANGRIPSRYYGLLKTSRKLDSIHWLESTLDVNVVFNVEINEVFKLLSWDILPTNNPHIFVINEKVQRVFKLNYFSFLNQIDANIFINNHSTNLKHRVLNLAISKDVNQPIYIDDIGVIHISSDATDVLKKNGIKGWSIK